MNYETKAGSAIDVAEGFDEFMRAFEAFKEANDARLEEVEKRMTADVVTAEKLERINAALDGHKRTVDTLVHKAHRPELAQPGSTVACTEHKAAFGDYVRHGETASLRGLEAKALSATSDPDGGYLVPQETEAGINRSLAAVSPIRAIAGNRQVSSSVFKKPYAVTGAGTGWVGESDPRVETASPQLAELTFPTMELYAMPAATATLLDDAAIDVDAWIAEEVRLAFAEQEGAAFVNGDGVNKPRGFMDYPTVDQFAWSWGNIGTVSTGTAGGFDASAPGDALIDLMYAVKAGYRSNGHFVMNRATQAEVRKLKDADGNYLWQPASDAGGASTLMNVAIVEAEDMPDIAAGANAIAFGDFSRGYLVVDRVGIRVLRDPYSAKPYVLFYTTKRVGGGVQDFDAIKLLSF
ncbi:MAG: phage major capsid protein [Pseudomonadota bacterium]